MKDELKLTEEVLQSPILNDKWIFHGFKIDLIKPENSSHEEFLNFCEKNMQPDILHAVSTQILESDSVIVKKFLLSGLPKELIYLASMQKNPTIRVVYDKEYNYSLLIRFNDMTEESNKFAMEHGGSVIIEKGSEDKREYNFSPVQMMKSIPIMQDIELILIKLLKIKQHEECTSFLYNDNNKPVIQTTDGIAYNIYPIEKRAELFSKHPKIDEALFGLNFKDFIKWFWAKKNDSDYMKEYCSKVEGILKDHKISYEY